MSHTPGPWKLDTVPISNGSGSCHRIGEFPGPSSYQATTCACVYADGIRIGIDDRLPRAIELAANARLIAAAPDLLEALRRSADEFDEISQRTADRQDMITRASLAAISARAVIAKAEGRS